MNDTADAVTDEVFRFSSNCEGEKILFQMSRDVTLTVLLKNFKHFLNASGFEYVKVIEAKTEHEIYSSDEEGMYEGTLGDCVQAIAEVDSDESDDLPF
jgi:hypothetical protein